MAAILVPSLVAGVLVVSILVPSLVAGGPLVPVAAWILARIFTAGHVGGYARQLLSAAGSLASELKVSGLFSKCDCSKYQLFGCPF